MLNIFLVVFGIISMAIVGIWPSDQARKISKRLDLWLIVVGGLVILEGSILLYIQQVKIENELRNKTTRIETLSREIVDLNRQLTEKKHEITATVSGGDSFCYIKPLADDVSQRVSLQLLHEGKHPIYDISISIFDQTAFGQLLIKKLYEETIKGRKKDHTQGRRRKGNLMGDLNKLSTVARFHREINMLPPNTLKELARYPLPQGDEHRYFIQIFTRNSFFTQTIRGRRVKGNGWRYSIRVKRHSPKGKDTILKERLYPDIPIE
jgi:hypothetical protein